jgi:hypothetical protein
MGSSLENYRLKAPPEMGPTTVTTRRGRGAATELTIFGVTSQEIGRTGELSALLVINRSSASDHRRPAA